MKCLHPQAVTVLAGMFIFCLAGDADARGGGGGGGFRGGGSYGSVRQSGVYSGNRSVSRPERPPPDSWDNSRDMEHGRYGSVRQSRGEDRISDRNSRRDGREDGTGERQDRRQRIKDSRLGEYAALREVRESREDFIYYAYDNYWYDWDDWYLDNYDYYDHWYYPAAEFAASPTPVVIGEEPHYYTSEGYWYTEVSNEGETGYVRISTPAGYEAGELPAEYKAITSDGKTYYVSNGTFYISIQRDSGNAYLVITPPFGIEVPELPGDAVAVKEEGFTYYQQDLTWYRKIADDGKTSSKRAYVVVASPFKK